jgi:hypothetical protein
MVINQVNVASRICSFIISKNQPAISSHGHAPKAIKFSFERMKLPTRESANLIQTICRLKSK